MALPVDATIQLPQPAVRGNAEIGSATAKGVKAIYRCLNTLFEQKKGALVNDLYVSGIYGTGSAPVQKTVWKVRNPLYAGWTSTYAAVDVWVYLRMTSTGGAWELRLTEPGGASTTWDMHAEATTSGAWVNLGTVAYDDSIDTGVWHLDEPTNTATGSQMIQGICIQHQRDLTALQAINGGYSDAADEVYPFDDTISHGGENPMSTWAIRNAHHMARYLWTKRLGQIITSSLQFHDNTGGGQESMARFYHLTPHKVTGATFYVRDGKYGAGTAKLLLDDVEVDSAALDGLGGWTELTATVEPERMHMFEITTNKDVWSICGHWDDAGY